MEEFERDICVNLVQLCKTFKDISEHIGAFVRVKEDEVHATNRLADAIEGIGRSIMISAGVLGLVFISLWWK